MVAFLLSIWGFPYQKLHAADCEKLVDKMIHRIRIWNTRNIFFAGKRQLVNYVLLNISVYWAQIFLLPKSLIKQINAICRAFLWTGTCKLVIDCNNLGLQPQIKALYVAAAEKCMITCFLSVSTAHSVSQD